MHIDEILKKKFIEDQISKLGEDLVLIERPAAFIIRAKNEDDRDVSRTIILPPRGYTSNEINQTNCYQGVEKGTIDFKGAIRDEKKSFSKVSNALILVSFDEKELNNAELDRPYLEYDIADPEPRFKTKVFNSHEAPKTVVKSDGTGFYHTLVNNTDEWLFLSSRKLLQPSRDVDLDRVLGQATPLQKDLIEQYHEKIVEVGDNLFDEYPDLVDRMLKIPLNVLLPAVGEMLYTPDRGEHETCTAFGTMLKISKFAPTQTLNYLKSAKENGEIPNFFAGQLIDKIEKRQESQDFKQGRAFDI